MHESSRVTDHSPRCIRCTGWPSRYSIMGPACPHTDPGWKSSPTINSLWSIIHSERMISSEHDGWPRHIQLYGDTNSRRRINQLPPLSPITWRELMPSDVIRVPVDNVCNVSDLKSYTTQNTQTLNGFKRFSYNSKVQISS